MYQNTINKLTEKNVLLESENAILRHKLKEKNRIIKSLQANVKSLEIDNTILKATKQEYQFTIEDFID